MTLCQFPGDVVYPEWEGDIRYPQFGWQADKVLTVGETELFTASMDKVSVTQHPDVLALWAQIAALIDQFGFARFRLNGGKFSRFKTWIGTKDSSTPDTPEFAHNWYTVVNDFANVTSNDFPHFHPFKYNREAIISDQQGDDLKMAFATFIGERKRLLSTAVSGWESPFRATALHLPRFLESFKNDNSVLIREDVNWIQADIAELDEILRCFGTEIENPERIYAGSATGLVDDLDTLDTEFAVNMSSKLIYLCDHYLKERTLYPGMDVSAILWFKAQLNQTLLNWHLASLSRGKAGHLHLQNNDPDEVTIWAENTMHWRFFDPRLRIPSAGHDETMYARHYGSVYRSRG